MLNFENLKKNLKRNFIEYIFGLIFIYFFSVLALGYLFLLISILSFLYLLGFAKKAGSGNFSGIFFLFPLYFAFYSIPFIIVGLLIKYLFV